MTIYTSRHITNEESGVDVPPSMKGGRVRIAMGNFIIPAGATDPGVPGAKTMKNGDTFFFCRMPSYASVQRIWCAWDGGAWSGSTTLDIGLYFADHIKVGSDGGAWVDDDDYEGAGYPLRKADILAMNGGVFNQSHWNADGGGGNLSEPLALPHVECYAGDLALQAQTGARFNDGWFETSYSPGTSFWNRAGTPIWQVAESNRPKDPNIDYYLGGQIKSSGTATTVEEIFNFTVFYTTD